MEAPLPAIKKISKLIKLLPGAAKISPALSHVAVFSSGRK
jgi:hypothetical protein